MDNKKMTTINLIDQQRARKALQYAFAGIKATQSAHSSQSTYRTVVLRFPMMIKVNGLAYSLAFAFSKAKKDVAYRMIYRDIHNWLLEDPQGLLSLDKENEFIQSIIELEFNELMWATHEVLKLLNWMKRFVQEE